MPPMPPMLFVLDLLQRGRTEGVGRDARLPDRGLAGPHEPGGPGVGELIETGGDELAAAALRVEHDPHRVGDLRGADRRIAMDFVPCRKRLDDSPPVRIVGLRRLDLLDRVRAAERQKWVAHPLTEQDPGFRTRG